MRDKFSETIRRMLIERHFWLHADSKKPAFFKYWKNCVENAKPRNTEKYQFKPFLWKIKKPRLFFQKENEFEKNAGKCAKYWYLFYDLLMRLFGWIWVLPDGWWETERALVFLLIVVPATNESPKAGLFLFPLCSRGWDLLMRFVGHRTQKPDWHIVEIIIWHFHLKEIWVWGENPTQKKRRFLLYLWNACGTNGLPTKLAVVRSRENESELDFLADEAHLSAFQIGPDILRQREGFQFGFDQNGSNVGHFFVRQIQRLSAAGKSSHRMFRNGGNGRTWMSRILKEK